MKRLYRSYDDHKLGGVIGGLAVYLEIDPNILRLLTILVFFLTGFFPVLITYIAAWLMVPEEPRAEQNATVAS